ncbi:hypothetical protein [Tropicimonas sp. IMCC34011]|uniref:hypothetical protein n=1 Tax=Tropicimonas sp. IMCC34011 TaxID=2248759 RepID=UPI0013003DCE|nr:hypothetical protein [Tropicimonas sp. IMCC34011]
MQLLTTTNVYGPDDQSNEAFLELVRVPPPGIMILDGNAGLGADWPAGIWKSMQGASVALAIFAAPSTIEENWPLWKEIFDDIAQRIMEFHGEYRIDRDSAQVIAMHHSVAVWEIAPNRMSVHMAVRHYFSTAAGYQDLLETDRVDMDWPERGEFGSEGFSVGVRSNEEAARQARCRYIFGIDDGSKCLTIVVESDGTVSFAQELDMKHEWG